MGKDPPDQVPYVLGLLLIGELGIQGHILRQLLKSLLGQLGVEDLIRTQISKSQRKYHLYRDFAGVASRHRFVSSHRP